MKTFLKRVPVSRQNNCLKLISLFIIFWFNSQTGFAQSKGVIDSLDLVLSQTKDDLEKVKVYNQLAKEFISSDCLKVVSYANKAIVLSKSAKYYKGIADAWYYIGTSHRVRGYIYHAEKWFKDSRNFCDSLGLQNEYARATSGLGTIYSIQRDFEKAIPLLNEALKIYRNLDNKDGLSTVYMEFGVINKNLAEYDKAMDYYSKALAINLELDNKFFILRCYYNMAGVYMHTGDLVKSLEHFLKAVEMAREISDRHAEAVILSSIGQIFQQQLDTDQALDYYFKALKISEEIGNTLEILSLKFKMGNAYIYKNQSEQALKLFEEGYQMAINLGNKNYEASAYYSIGEVYYRRDEYEKALNYFNKTRSIFVDLGERGQLSHLLIYMGDAHRRLKQYTIAKQLLEEGITLAKEIDYPIALRDGLEMLAHTEKALENSDKAFEAYVSFKEIYDSLRNDEVTQKITRLQADYEFQLEKDSIAFEQSKIELSYEQEIQRRKTINQAAVGGGVLVLIILILLYRSYLIKQKRNLELSHKNEVIELKNNELLTKNEEINALRESEKKMAEVTIGLKERELTNVTMLSHEKNELLLHIGDQIGKLGDKVDEKVIPDLKEIKHTIKSNISDETWNAFTYHFEQVHPEFFNKLKHQYSDLNQNDLRLCAYIKVGLNNKVIAQMNNVTLAGVKKNINRLKKKIEIGPDDSLRDFMMEFV